MRFGHGHGGELEDRHDPHRRVGELIEPFVVVATNRVMRNLQREYMPRQPSLPTLHPSPRRVP